MLLKKKQPISAKRIYKKEPNGNYVTEKCSNWNEMTGWMKLTVVRKWQKIASETWKQNNKINSIWAEKMDWKQNIKSLMDLWENNKVFTFISFYSQSQKECGYKVFVNIMAETFPNLMKYIKCIPKRLSQPHIM